MSLIRVPPEYDSPPRRRKIALHLKALGATMVLFAVIAFLIYVTALAQ